MSSDRIPWPTLHGGLTADDLPYGYSAYNSVFDDGLGYEPRVVSESWDDTGHLTILVALSPGHYVPVTMVVAGQAPGEAGRQVLEALQALAVRPSVTGPGTSPGAPGSDQARHQSREAD